MLFFSPGFSAACLEASADRTIFSGSDNDSATRHSCGFFLETLFFEVLDSGFGGALRRVQAGEPYRLVLVVGFFFFWADLNPVANITLCGVSSNG